MVKLRLRVLALGVLTLGILGAAPTLAGQSIEKIKAGDKLKLTVSEEPSINREYKVTPDGLILVNFLGAVKVTGLTPDEAAKKVSDRLVSDKILRTATVSVAEVASIKQIVNFEGRVEEPGQLPFQEGMTLADVIRQAGITPDTDLNMVTVKHVSGTMEQIDFTKYDPKTGQGNVILKAGDTVIFGTKGVTPSANPAASMMVSIEGEIFTSGQFASEPGLTVQDVIAKAGGFKATSDVDHATLVRGGESRTLALPQDGLMIVQPGDKILIARHVQVFSVIVAGAVLHPGTLQIGDKIKLTDLVERAGGLAENASDKVRISPANGQIPPYVVSLSKVQNGYTGDPILETGTKIEFLKKDSGIAAPNRTITAAVGATLLWFLFKK